MVYVVVAKNIVALPKSVTHSRILSNLKGTLAAAAKLTKEDIAQLDAVEDTGKHVRVVHPPWGMCAFPQILKLTLTLLCLLLQVSLLDSRTGSEYLVTVRCSQEEVYIVMIHVEIPCDMFPLYILPGVLFKVPLDMRQPLRPMINDDRMTRPLPYGTMLVRTSLLTGTSRNRTGDNRNGGYNLKIPTNTPSTQ